MSDQDNIPTPRTLFEEIRSEIIRVERELATVTKERDHWKRECNIETLRAGERATERDSLRAKVERLKVENDKLTNRNAALAVMAGIHEPAQSEPSQAAEVSHLNTVPLTQEEAKMTTAAMMQEFEEPSQVGGKEDEIWRHVGRFQKLYPPATPSQLGACKEVVTELVNKIAAAQATIADLSEKWGTLGTECAKLRDENAALRAEGNAQKFCEECNSPLSQCGEPNAEGEPSLDCLPCRLRAQLTTAIAERNKKVSLADYDHLRGRLATAIADRNAEHQFGSQMQAERDSVQSQLNAEKVKLGAAIAERDKAIKSCQVMAEGRKVCLGIILIATGKLAEGVSNGLREIVAQRDSALAACAAKDVALRETMDHLSRHDSGVNHWREKEVSVIRPFPNNIHAYHAMREALSPAAGSDYVPKAPMVELRRAANEFKNAKDHFEYSAANYRGAVHNQELVDLCNKATLRLAHAENALTAALRAAAPFLTG